MWCCGIVTEIKKGEGKELKSVLSEFFLRILARNKSTFLLILAEQERASFPGVFVQLSARACCRHVT
jgi:hypothetical protein